MPEPRGQPPVCQRDPWHARQGTLLETARQRHPARRESSPAGIQPHETPGSGPARCVLHQEPAVDRPHWQRPARDPGSASSWRLRGTLLPWGRERLVRRQCDIHPAVLRQAGPGYARASWRQSTAMFPPGLRARRRQPTIALLQAWAPRELPGRPPRRATPRERARPRATCSPSGYLQLPPAPFPPRLASKPPWP